MSENSLNESLRTLSKTIRDNTLSITIDQTIADPSTERDAITSEQQKIGRKNLDASKVTASASGTSANEVSYITIDDTEYKLAGGGEGPSYQAGNGITINGNTISALYSAGSGINIDEDYEISTNYDNVDIGSGLVINGSTIEVDFTKVQNKLTAGNNIDITNNIISASFSVATTISAGLMSAADKTKLDGINQYIKQADVSSGTLIFTDNQNNSTTKIGKGLRMNNDELELDESIVPIADLPKLSGLYVLKVTIENGIPQYQWEQL